MEKIVINGGKKLHGSIRISGSKNATVAILPALILCEGVCRIENIPNIVDVNLMATVMYNMGADIKRINKSTIEINTANIRNPVAVDKLVGEMRASSYFMGALLGRFSHAEVSFPGGCDFGVRPLDLHLKGFSMLGAKYSISDGIIKLDAEKIVGERIYLDVASVGATVNIMLAAVKGEGTTTIENAAKEPHVVDLANFLNSVGADVRGAGTDVIKINGVKHLGGSTYTIIPDQIEAGTYMAAAVATEGDVTLTGVIPKHLESITAKLREIGAVIDEYDDSIRIRCSGRPHCCDVTTTPHPGFPTDMQPQIATILSFADGASRINEAVWDNRFCYVTELQKMGANINVDGGSALIKGVDRLAGAPVKAVDLRAGAAMIVAGLAASGTTYIQNIHYIERGYEDVVEKLTALGADIKRIYDNDPSIQTA